MDNFNEDEIKYTKEILNKIKRKEPLDKEELCWVIHECGIYTDESDDGRWYRFMSTLSKLDDTYVVTNWQHGLTEHQESMYDEDPVIVTEIKTKEVKKYKHTIYLDNGKTLKITNSNPKFEL